MRSARETRGFGWKYKDDWLMAMVSATNFTSPPWATNWRAGE